MVLLWKNMTNKIYKINNISVQSIVLSVAEANSYTPDACSGVKTPKTP